MSSVWLVVDVGRSITPWLNLHRSHGVTPPVESQSSETSVPNPRFSMRLSTNVSKSSLLHRRWSVVGANLPSQVRPPGPIEHRRQARQSTFLKLLFRTYAPRSLSEQSSTSPTAAVPATQASSAPGRSALKKDLPQLFTSQPQSNSLKQVLLSKFLASPAETSPLEPPAQTHDASSAKELVGHGYQIPSIFQKRRERSMVDSSSSSIASSTVTKKPLAPKAPDSNTTGPKQKIIPKAWEMTRKLGILKSTPCLQALEEWLFFPSVGMDVRRSLSNHRTCALAVEGECDLRGSALASIPSQTFL